MKIVIKNGTAELENTLRQNGYDIDVYDDDVVFFTEVEVEVEKIVETEKPLPAYLEAIDAEINKLIDEKIEDKAKEYEVYKTKYEKLEALFKGDEVVDEE